MEAGCVGRSPRSLGFVQSLRYGRMGCRGRRMSALSAAVSALVEGGIQVHAILDREQRIVAASEAFASLIALEPWQLRDRALLEILSDWQSRVTAHEFVASIERGLHEVTRTHAAQVGPICDVFRNSVQGIALASAARLMRASLVPLQAGDEQGLTALCIEDLTHVVAVALAFEQDRVRASRERDQLRGEWDTRLQERTADLEHANAQLLREIAQNIKTEKALQRSQEQLHHAQRLEAVGRLAGGIAHDFNNLLSIVLGYSAALIDQLPADSPLCPDLDEIRQAGERASELTRQLLAFGRQQVLEPKVLDLNETVSRVDRMMRRVLGADIQVIAALANPLWTVKIDPGQIEQVLINLVLNARDAMPNGGTLTLETYNAVFDEAYAQAHLGASVGQHVVLAVTDTGTGMDKETQSRAFEPFFTTKDKGKGSGLGLATAFGIVKQSGGHIWLYSELGQGTSFKVCFPRSEDPVSPASTDRQRDQLAAAHGGDETILLVEDDAQLRTLARTILVRYGYQVLDAPNAAEALVLSARFSGEIALLLTDVVMPQMGGRELARQLVGTRPNTKVLYMSGYTDNSVVHHGILDPGVSFLQKPITPEILARRVREVLDAAGAKPAV